MGQGSDTLHLVLETTLGKTCYFLSFFLSFLKIPFIHLRERVHKQEEQQAEGKGEAGSALSGEPDIGLDPRVLGSQPSRGQMLTQLSHQAPQTCYFHLPATKEENETRIGVWASAVMLQAS